VTPFVPWSVPACLALLAGIAAHQLGVPAAVTCSVSAIVAALLVASSPRRRRGLRTLAWVACLAVVPLGQLRTEQRAARPDPLAPLEGRRVELAGRSDGRLLHLDGVSALVALRPTGTVPRARVRVVGRLEPAHGARNPGGFDELAWLRRLGGSQLLRIDRVTASVTSRTFRDRVRDGVTGGLEDEPAQLMRVLVLGEREVAGELRDRFARAGLAHLLALSGLHLGVLAGAVAVLLAPLGPVRWTFVAATAIGFALWIGPTPSLVRAAVMTSLAAAALGLGSGRPGPIAVLAAAAGATLVARPDWLFDLGFQLSYLSILGIVAFGAPLARRFAAGRAARDPRTWVAASLAVSTSAWAAGLPLVLAAFGEASPLAPVVNLAAVPIASVLVPLGLAGGLLGAAHPLLAVPVGWLTEPLAGLLLATAESAARLPAVGWSGVGPFGSALYWLSVAPWAWTIRDRLRPWRAALVSLVALSAGLALPETQRGPQAIVLDVGQGDAIVLRLPGGNDLLVDGGGTPFGDYDVGAGVVVPALRALGISDLELVVSTHADLDHAEGLTTVLREVPSAALGIGHAAPGEPAWERLAAVASAEGVPMLQLRRGQSLPFGEAVVHVVHPTATPSGVPNDDSVVLRVDWRGRPWLLLAGDVSSTVERTLALPPLEALLAPHHGSGSSTGSELLRAARPKVVAISVGRNRYGHPSPAVLGRLADAGAKVLRTDQDGAIRLSPAW